MHDINLIRNNPGTIQDAIAKRGITVDFTALLRLDEKKRKTQTDLEGFKAEKNRASTEISKITDRAEKEKRVQQMKTLGESISSFEKVLEKLEGEIYDIMSVIPNIVLPEVGTGGKESNKVVKTFGEKPKFDFKPKDHVELCTTLGLIDYERGTKMSGSGHWVYTGMGARLELALWNYFIDYHVANGYTLIMPPHILNYESGYAAGQFPKYQDEVFLLQLGKDGDKMKQRFLLPTSETALINMHRGEIIPMDKLPIKYAGFSPCYRGEPGGYGKTERGSIRGHQFNKVEMYAFCMPNQSYAIHDEFTRHAESLVEGLGLHYQTCLLAAGDTGPVMAKTYDIEVFIPSMDVYKEVSSNSNALDFQTRRALIRTKVGDKTEYLHTLNASGLATSRIIPAIVEQFQTKDGRVRVPSVLQKYLGGIDLI